LEAGGGVRGRDRLCGMVRNFLVDGVTGEPCGASSRDNESDRGRLIGCRASICSGSGGDRSAAWGSPWMCVRSTIDFTEGVDGGGVDDDGRGRIGGGFARTGTADLT